MPMTREEANAALETALSEVAPEVDLGAVNRTGPLQEELDLDSMDFLNLVAAILVHTGLDIPDRDYPLLGTVDSCLDYLVAQGDTVP